MSPVWNQPPANAAAVASGSRQYPLNTFGPAQDDLPTLPCGQRPPLVVPDVELEVEARTADAAELA